MPGLIEGPEGWKGHAIGLSPRKGLHPGARGPFACRAWMPQGPTGDAGNVFAGGHFLNRGRPDRSSMDKGQTEGKTSPSKQVRGLNHSSRQGLALGGWRVGHHRLTGPN